MERVLVARGIAFLDGKLLCVQNVHPDGNADMFWCLPGGAVATSESLVQALQREFVEQLGVPPVIGDLLYVQRFTRGNVERVEFFFHITNASDYNAIDLARVPHALAKIARAAFIIPRTSVIQPEILRTEDLETIAELGKTTILEEL